MAKIDKIYQICQQCEGDKVINDDGQGHGMECPACKGKGKILWGEIKKEEQDE